MKEPTATKTTERIKKEKPAHGFWYYMPQYLRGFEKNIVLTVIGSIVAGVCVAIQPLVIKYVVDDGITPGVTGTVTKQHAIATVACLCAFYVFISLIRLFSYRFATYNVLQAQEGALFKMRSRFFSHIQHLCMRFHDKTPSGDLYNSIMGSPMASIKTFLHNIIINVPYQVISFAISMVALFSYDWILTLSMLGIACVMILLNRLSRMKIRRVSRALLSAETEASKYITDMLQGSEAVKLYSIEDNAVRDFDERLSSLKQAGIQSSFTNIKEAMKPELANYVGNALVYFVGAFVCLYRGVSTGTLFAFLTSMGSILSTLSMWLGMALTKNSVDVAMDKINAVINEATSTPDVDEGHTRSIEIERMTASADGLPCIEFKNVSFGYDDRMIFDNFSCQMKYGESIALVGSSGSGKSTLTKLIMRLYEINGGSVLLHGRDVRDYNTHELRYSFGVVPQNPFIFRGTIWDNIRIVRPDAPNIDVINAMEVARVHEFVNNLPMGWSTQIGDGALSLSGGQKQRIAIARAILKNPDILIFDEATSALDNISERHIQEAMEELMKTHTVIIVAHRLSTIKNVDRILVFDNGKIVQEGKFDVLANQEGMFRNMLYN